MAARTVTEFRNEPFTDFSRPENKAAFEQALARVGKSLGREHALVIGAESVTTADKIRSLNPANPAQVVGIFPRGTADHANAAVEAALRAFETWKFVEPAERAEYLFKAADIMRRKKHDLSALMVYEVGKSWPEADGDTAEAIDFLEYYAREMLRYAAPQPLTRVAGEKNELVYIPLGVGAIIPPWNFPLAILTGMASAAIVTGNTVVIKPSTDSATIGYQFVDVMREAGLPPGVCNFVSGGGSDAGEALVVHPKVRFIAFTGSKEVGLHINEVAAKPRPGQLWIKRVVAEMGGKDSIVVDADTDIDAAATGVAQSAYGFQGQKCSACSRAIVVDSVYDAFCAKLVEKVKAIRVGDPADPATYMGPVINAGAEKSILSYIEHGKKDGRLLTGGGKVAGRAGYFVEPTVIADVDPMSKISQEEIFGPVLAVIRAKDFDHALAIANNTEFGLTGAVYTRDRAKLERAKRLFHVGNLYLNRKCTGALVGVHPFGGFNMSGTDSKAGGRDYLLLFLQAKSMSEKIG